MRIAAGISYRGTNYHGWQYQPQRPSVQGIVEAAASKIENAPIHVLVAGRTDAGVHATGQVIAFTSQQQRDEATWFRGLNALTPNDIRIDWVRAVPEDFHPRYAATARRYVYLFLDKGSQPDPMLEDQVWSCLPLDADAMDRAAQALIGEHDFSSFRGSGCQSLTPMRRVNRLRVTRQGSFVVMMVEANAFVLHMVRNLASALHDIGIGRHLEITSLLRARDRTLLGRTAPPQGLYLQHVEYPQHDVPGGLLPAIIRAF